MRRLLLAVSFLALPLLAMGPRSAESACCYFAAKDKDILQPAQKAFITWDPKAVKMRGAVSPTMRATPRSTAVTTPDRAVGMTTDHTVRHSGAPRACDASRRPLGTTRSTSSTTRVTDGRRTTVRASEAAKPE